MVWLTCGQTTAKATEFYNTKIKGLENNLKDLAKVVQGKDVQLRAIEDGEYQAALEYRSGVITNFQFSPKAKGSQW